MTTREQAINWWNNLKLTQRVAVMNRNNVEPYRSSETLTGTEIEEIWRKETKTEENIYLNRLKEQYYEVKRCLFPNEADYVRARYGGMREFCLDTQLISFNDIEVMESEVNKSFS